MRDEPRTPDLRKQAFYANLGAAAARGEFRSVGLKDIDTYRLMFPTMFEGLDTSLPSVSPISGQKLTLVWNCLNVRGETIGSLPCSVMRYTDKGPESDYNHPVYRLLHDRPNAHMTAFDFWSTVEKIKHVDGNAFVLIDNDGVDPIALYPFMPGKVTIIKTIEGEVYYKVDGKTFRSTDILHFKNYTTNGYIGISTITANALSVGLGLKVKNYNSTLVGTRGYGYLTGPKPKDEMQKSQMKGMWNKDFSNEPAKVQAETIHTNAFGDIPYLYGGVEFKPMTLSADESAYIESAEMNDRDILGMFRMPPTMVSIYKDAPYNSSEQQDIAFVKYTMASLRQYEQECTEKLFPVSNRRREKSWYVKFNLNGLLRGDMKARREFYASGIQSGWLTPNQVCEFEELPTYEGGDRHYLQGALIPTDKVDEFLASKSAKQENQPDNQVAKDEERARIGDEVRRRLNGSFKQVADLFE